jgi:hypothetical protein
MVAAQAGQRIGNEQRHGLTRLVENAEEWRSRWNGSGCTKIDRLGLRMF